MKYVILPKELLHLTDKKKKDYSHITKEILDTLERRKNDRVKIK